jgi:hypothetical protein
MTVTTSSLYREAVAYAAKQITAGSDPQQIEWDLLNLDQFSPLISSFDIEDLYQEVVWIIENGEEAAEDERLRVMERDAQRYEQYLSDYPELDTHREW